MRKPYRNMIEGRHFEIKRKSWYIGHGRQAFATVEETLEKFYGRLVEILNVSEEIRLMNSQMVQVHKIKDQVGSGTIGGARIDAEEHLSDDAKAKAERLLLEGKDNSDKRETKVATLGMRRNMSDPRFDRLDGSTGPSSTNMQRNDKKSSGDQPINSAGNKGKEAKRFNQSMILEEHEGTEDDEDEVGRGRIDKIGSSPGEPRVSIGSKPPRLTRNHSSSSIAHKHRNSTDLGQGLQDGHSPDAIDLKDIGVDVIEESGAEQAMTPSEQQDSSASKEETETDQQEEETDDDTDLGR